MALLELFHTFTGFLDLSTIWIYEFSMPSLYAWKKFAFTYIWKPKTIRSFRHSKYEVLRGLLTVGDVEGVEAESA